MSRIAGLGRQRGRNWNSDELYALRTELAVQHVRKINCTGLIEQALKLLRLAPRPAAASIRFLLATTRKSRVDPSSIRGGAWFLATGNLCRRLSPLVPGRLCVAAETF